MAKRHQSFAELCYQSAIPHTVTSQKTVLFLYSRFLLYQSEPVMMPSIYEAFHCSAQLQSTNRILLSIRQCINIVCANVNCKVRLDYAEIQKKAENQCPSHSLTLITLSHLCAGHYSDTTHMTLDSALSWFKR